MTKEAESSGQDTLSRNLPLGSNSFHEATLPNFYRFPIMPLCLWIYQSINPLNQWSCQFWRCQHRHTQNVIHHVLGISVYVCAHVCAYVHMCVHVCIMCMWKAEVDGRCLPRLLSTLFLRQGLSLSLTLVNSGELMGWEGMFRDLWISLLHLLSFVLTEACHCTSFSPWAVGIWTQILMCVWQTLQQQSHLQNFFWIALYGKD